MQYPNLSFESRSDRGIYDAINRAIKRSTGDIVGLLHSDDFFAGKDVVYKIFKEFENKEIDGVYGDLQYVRASDINRVIRHWRSGEFNAEALKRGWMAPHPTLYLRRSVFERFGYYDTSFRISADYDAMLRIMKNEQISLAYIPEVLVRMRIGGASNRTLTSILRKMREDYRAAKNNNIGGIKVVALKNFRKINQII